MVDEEALVEALKSGQVSAAGLDVFEHEPQVHPYLLDSDNVLLQPHAGGYTEHTHGNIEMETIANMERYLETGTPDHAVNKPRQ